MPLGSFGVIACVAGSGFTRGLSSIPELNVLTSSGKNGRITPSYKHGKIFGQRAAEVEYGRLCGLTTWRLNGIRLCVIHFGTEVLLGELSTRRFEHN